MKISVSQMTWNAKSTHWTKRTSNQYLLHAIIIPVRKGVWWFHVDFKTRIEKIAWYGSDGKYDEHVAIRLVGAKGKEVYAQVTFDFRKEKQPVNVYGQTGKTGYHGIVIESNMISKAVDEFGMQKKYDKIQQKTK